MKNTCYDKLGLDQILEITAADARHAPDMRAQSSAAQTLADRVGDSLDRIAAARATLEDKSGPDAWSSLSKAFSGSAASATFDQITKLTERSGTGHKALQQQPGTFTSLAAESESTHRNMLDLRTERDGWLRTLEQHPHDPALTAKFGGGSPEQTRQAINDEYDGQARTHMHRTNSSYLQSVRQLEPVDKYEGPRTSRPGSQNRPFLSQHSTPGPQLQSWTPPKNVHYPDMVAPHKPFGPGVDVRPDFLHGVQIGPKGPKLQSIHKHGSKTVDVKPHKQHGGQQHPNKPHHNQNPPPHRGGNGPRNGGRPNRGGKGGNGRPNRGGGRYEPNRPYTRPVIGQRGGVEPVVHGETAQPQSIRSGADVSRSTVVTPRTVTDAPVPSRGITPPVLGRQATATAPSWDGNGLARRGGSTVPGARPAPRTFLNPRAGTRVPPEATHTADGQVIRSRPRLTEPAKPPAFRRDPRMVHGGTDGLNRAVVRNSRVPRTPAPQPIRTSEAAPRGSGTASNPDWAPTAPTVAPVIRGHRYDADRDIDGHDPGYVLTAHNLGRPR